MATANVWAQLPYNTTMTQSHFNSSSTKIASSGDNAWDGGVRLGGSSTSVVGSPAWNWDDKYIIIVLSSNGIPNRLTCTTSTNSNSTSETKFYVATSTNNSSYTEIWSSADRNNTIDIALSKDVKYIKICYSGNFAGYFKNIKVTELKYFNSPSTADIAFEQKILNSTPSVSDFTIDWCNVPAISYSIEGTHKDKFSVTKIENNSSVGKYGTATIHLSYIHDDFAGEDQPHTATLKLWSNGTTYNVTLTGVTDRYIADFNWNIANVNANSGEYHVGDSVAITDAYTLKNKTTDNAISLPVNFTIETLSRSAIYQEDGDGDYHNDVLCIQGGVLKAKNAGVAKITASFAGNDEYKPFTKELTLTINKHDVNAFMVQSTAVWNERINNPFYLTDGLSDFTVGKSSDENIAKYDASTKTIQTYYTDGAASFQITRPEDYKYNALDQTLTLEVRSDTEKCYLISGQSVTVNHETGKNSSGVYSADFPLNGAGGVLTFNYKLNNDADVEHYITPQYSTTDNESDFTDIPNSKITTKSDSEQQTGEIIVPDGAKRIRFKRTAETIGTKNFSLSNITVTRKQFIEPQIDGETFYLTQLSSGMQFAGMFDLAWSTCSGNIRLACDNPNFTIIPSVVDASSGQGTTSIIVTYSANTSNPDLTGTLTIYDQSQTKTITLSCEHMIQVIDWPQVFHNLEADENGNINQDIELNAIARTVTGQATNRPIQYNLSVSPDNNASIYTDANGKSHLYITGICEGTITASVEGFTDANGRIFTASSSTRQIRIRRAGDPCNSYALYITDLQTITLTNSTKIFPISGSPENQMTFIAHTDVLSVNNELTIDFSKDGNNWGNEQTIDIKSGTSHSTYACSVPDEVSFVRFRTSSTLGTYFDMVTIRQKEYLTASVDEITISNATVNQPFSATFTVDYSDVPYIQHAVTNNHNLNLQLTPSPEINNSCGQYGTYTFTLTGEIPYPQDEVQETITIFTSAGHRIDIPVIITATLPEPFYFNIVDNGDWKTSTNWTYQDKTDHGMLPDKQHPIVISKALIINDGELEAYGITINEGGSVSIQPTGGLTLHAGGFTNVTEDNFEVHNNLSGAGFVRVSKQFNQQGGTMPKVKVHFTTKANMNNGENKDAAWQYIGAPGAETQMQVVNTSTLYLRSEENGWVRQWDSNASLTPFAGYAFTQKDQPSIAFAPRLVTDNQTITLTYTEDGMKGDNLWANSYMAPIDVTKFTDEDFTGNIVKTFYLYNSGSWNAWNEGMQDGTSANGGDTPGRYYAINLANVDATRDQVLIPPMQGVYMVAHEGGGSVKLNYEKHVWNNMQTFNLNTPLRVAPHQENNLHSDLLRIRLQVNSLNSGADRMYIIQDSLTTSGYDNGYDAPKLMSEGLMNIYTNEPFGKMEISSTNDMDSMYIGFQAGEDTTYTMTFTSLIGEDLYIYDVEQDTLIGMSNGDTYEFVAAAKSVNDMRFQILVNPDLSDYQPNTGNGGDVTTNLNDVPMQQLWVHDEKIYISHASANSIVEVYTVSGMPVARYAIGYAPCVLDLSDMPTGVYMLRLNDTIYKFVCN
jgi:hypothetical protein